MVASVMERWIANFLNESGLTTSNILSRVTGGNISNVFRTTFLTANSMWDRIAVQEPLSTVESQDITETLAQLNRGGACMRRSFTLRMLGDPEDTVKLASMGFEEPGISEETLAFQIEAHNKRE